VSLTTGGEDVVAIGKSGTGLSAPNVVEAADEQSMIKERYSEGTASSSPTLGNPPTPLAGCEYIHFPVTGLNLHRKPLDARICAGKVAAEIVDPVTDKITPLVAEHGGILYARYWVRFETMGMLVLRLAGERAIRSGDLLVV